MQCPFQNARRRQLGASNPYSVKRPQSIESRLFGLLVSVLHPFRNVNQRSITSGESRLNTIHRLHWGVKSPLNFLAEPTLIILCWFIKHLTHA
jgi:hypothetical protein